MTAAGAQTLPKARPAPEPLPVSGPPYLLGLVLAGLWGIGKHLPQQEFYVFGIGPGDFLFLAYCAAALALSWHRWTVFRSLGGLRSFALLVVAFVALGLLSGTVNALRTGMVEKDLVETVRPLYYVLITAFTAAWVARYPSGQLIIAFLAGVVIVALTNLFHEAPAGIRLLGFHTMYNPNMMANMLGIGTFLASLLVLDGRFRAATLFMALFVPLSLFTYSKGGWLMVLVGLAAALTAFLGTGRGQRSPRRSSPAWMYTVIAAFVVGAAIAGPLILALVRFKLETTQFADTAAEGSTIAQRWGYVVASVRMAIDHPLVGVGISNYEAEYDRLSEFLGASYFPTDNPHSAFLYILACMGVPALGVFLSALVLPFMKLWYIVPLRSLSRAMYIALAVTVFLVSGSVQLQLISQPFWWFFAGIVFGWARRQVVVRERRPAT